MQRSSARTPLDALRTFYGFSAFRPGQEAVIRAILDGRDTLAILPTGGGKSLCYQIPALLLPGLTIVVSPLISLMSDQTQALKKRRIQADYLASDRTPDENRAVLEEARAGRLRLLYVSPERLASPGFAEALSGVRISFLCVDEAHCISEWGREFRPSYNGIPDFFGKSSSVRPVIAAFTATATPEVSRDIIEKLGLRNPFRTAALFDRPNLYFEVRHPHNKWRELCRFLSGHPGECGIIYCRTRVTTDALARRLRHAGYPALRYHGGMEADARREHESSWLSGHCPLMVATNAFGMGIDKPDVRFVVHYQMPGDMESYYQEAGRAGRDGKESVCLLLSDDRDLAISRFFIRMTRSPGLRASMENDLAVMRRFAAGTSCLRAEILRHFGEEAHSYCGKCSFCLGRGSLAYAAPAGAEDLRLRRELTALRHRIAREKGVLPWKIFSDQSLRDLACKRPETLAGMLVIEGINPLSCIKYGAEFLSEIRAWNQTHS